MARCPACGSPRLRRGRVRAHDGLRRMLFYSPLRCRDCNHRFWTFTPVRALGIAATGAGLVGLTLLFNTQTDPLGARPVSVQIEAPHERAAAGDADAQLALGLRYQQGDGVIKNPAEAARWFALAAKQGLPEAQYRYGLALLEGRGVVQDYQAAFAWIKKTAERGYAPAQLTLGELYRFGTGTEVDKARAYLWFNLAAAQGLDDAVKSRDAMALQLKPDELVAMQAEARRISGSLVVPADTPEKTAQVPETGTASRPD